MTDEELLARKQLIAKYCPETATNAEREGALIARLLEVEADSERLEALEKLVAENPGGLLIHHQVGRVEWDGVGLGLSHRPLRKVIDQARLKP